MAQTVLSQKRQFSTTHGRILTLQPPRLHRCWAALLVAFASVIIYKKKEKWLGIWTFRPLN